MPLSELIIIGPEIISLAPSKSLKKLIGHEGHEFAK